MTKSAAAFTLGAYVFGTGLCCLWVGFGVCFGVWFVPKLLLFVMLIKRLQLLIGARIACLADWAFLSGVRKQWCLILEANTIPEIAEG